MGMSDDLGNLNNLVKSTSGVLNWASSFLIGIDKYNETGNFGESALTSGVNFLLNKNPYVATVYTFGSMVMETTDFKQGMLQHWEDKMNESRNSNSRVFGNAERNYMKYINELGIKKEPINAKFEQRQ